MLGPKCCCLLPPYCCNQKSVLRWDIEAIDFEPEPGNCCDLLLGSYFPDEAQSIGDCFRVRRIAFPTPEPCVDYCNSGLLTIQTWYLSLTDLEIQTWLHSGTNTFGSNVIRTQITLRYLMYLSDGYTCVPANGGKKYIRVWQWASTLCQDLRLDFRPNSGPFPQGLPPFTYHACGQVNSDPIFRLTTVLE